MITTLLMAAAMTQTPPTKVPQPDGTIQLVPVPPAVVYTPYFIDPTMQYNVQLKSPYADGKILAFKDTIVTADLTIAPVAKSKVIDGKTVWMHGIYRSANIVVEYDHERLELLPPTNQPFNGFDSSTMDITKTIYEYMSDGLVTIKVSAMLAPELRTPPLAPKYYTWNFGGLLFGTGNRAVARLEFKVKDNYYLPTWGAQKSFIKLHDQSKYNTVIKGSPDNINVWNGMQTSTGSGIMFGVPASSTVSHYLSAPATKFSVGNTVQVQVMIKPDTLPQILSSVATNFGWDPNVLEFMGLDINGVEPYMSNTIYKPSADSINELPIPKDGNACHVWMSPLSVNKKYYDKPTVVGKLNFRVKVDFATTTVEIMKKNDPRLAGLVVLEESRPIGSSEFGKSILGSQTGVTINGVK